MRRSALALLLLAGCAGAFFPKPSRVAALDAIAAARASGAADTPAALYQLAIANQQMQIADAALREAHMEAASQALGRAEAAADLALTLRHDACCSEP